VKHKKSEMMTDEYKKYIGKEVVLILSNQMRYSGRILSVGNVYLKILDKFGKEVLVVLDQICSVEEGK